MSGVLFMLLFGMWSLFSVSFVSDVKNDNLYSISKPFGYDRVHTNMSEGLTPEMFLSALLGQKQLDLMF